MFGYNEQLDTDAERGLLLIHVIDITAKKPMWDLIVQDTFHPSTVRKYQGSQWIPGADQAIAIAMLYWLCDLYARRPILVEALNTRFPMTCSTELEKITTAALIDFIEHSILSSVIELVQPLLQHGKRIPAREGTDYIAVFTVKRGLRVRLK